MSRASKLASARGETHQARHSTNVAREKLQRVTDQRDMLRAEVERLRDENAAQSAALEMARGTLVYLAGLFTDGHDPIICKALAAIEALPAAPKGEV